MKMNQLCDGVIALPGGFGTMEEFFEMLTWGQLGLHRKPMSVLNIDGFYDTLLALAQHMVDKRFLKPANREMLLSATDIPELLRQMRGYQPPVVGKWITPETT